MYILFLTRNDLVIKILHILRLTAFGYSFIRCCSHCTVCSDILRLRDSTWSLNGVCLLIYVNSFYLRESQPRHEKLFYITSSCNLFIYYIEENHASQENLCYSCGVCCSVCYLRMLRWLPFRLFQAFFTWTDNYMLSMFDVWPADHYLQMCCMHQYVVCILFYKRVTLLHPFVPSSENIVNVGFKIYIIISIACVSGHGFGI